LEYFEMKKTFVALAALAVVSAASAQSSVTLYGVADTFFGQTKSGVGAAETTQTVINTNGINSSRWGVKGTEDLGGGLKANFVIESGFNLDNGNQSATQLFNRQAYVGLSGNFGAVNMGRQYTAYDALRGATNNTFDTAAFTPTGAVWGSGVADYSSRVDNSIAYISPEFSGVSGAVVLGLGENKTATVDANQNLSLHIKYAAGPVLVGYAYQEQKVQNAAVTGTDSTKYNLVAGSYDFGMVKLTGGYNTAKVAGLSDKEYQVGLNAPIGAAANVAIGYSNSKTDGQVAALKSQSSGYSLVGLYDLSKRTRLYAGYSKMTADTGPVTTGKSSIVAVGVRHAF
jgi:predicted porin